MKKIIISLLIVVALSGCVTLNPIPQGKTGVEIQ